MPSSSLLRNLIQSAPLLLVILAFCTRTTVASGVGDASSKEGSSQTLELPPFSFQMLVTDETNNLDLHELKTKLNHVTENHLSEFLQRALHDNGHRKEYFQGLYLQSTVKKLNGDSIVIMDGADASSEKTLVSSDFEGSAVFAPNIVNTAVLHILVAQAFMEDEYWNLVHRFVEDNTLANIDSLDVVLDNPTGLDWHSNPFQQEQAGRGGTIAILSIFSIILCGSTAFLLLLAYRRFRASSDKACCSDLFCNQSKHSDSTDDDDDDDHIFDDEEEGQFHSNPSPKKSHRKKRHARPAAAASIANLDSIQEDEEEEGDDDDDDDQEDDEEMAEIPLDSILI